MEILKKLKALKAIENNLKEEYISEQQFNEILDCLTDNIVGGKNRGRLDQLTYIRYVFGLLNKMDRQQRTKIISILAKYMKDFNRIHYIYLYQRFRNYYDQNWYNDYTTSVLKNLYTPEMTLEERITLLGLASFHPNGYFRGEAVNELIKLNHSEGLKFILIRCSDYVEPIRSQASQYIKQYVTYEHIPYIIKNIDFIQYIKVYIRSYKDQLQEVIDEKIESFYHHNRNEMTYYLIESLKINNKEIKEYCINSLIARKLLDAKDAISIIKNSKDRVVVAKVISSIINELTIQEVLDSKVAAVRSKAHKTQVIIIERLYHLGYYTKHAMLQNQAISPYRCIRECARYVMNKIGEIDFRVFYKEAMHQADKIHNSLMKGNALVGLCEVATKDDVPLLVQCLDQVYNTRTKKQLVATLSNLDFGAVQQTLLEIFAKGQLGSMKQVSKNLLEHLHEIDSNNLYLLYQNSSYHCVRQQAARLLCALRVWERIVYIIEICAAKEEEISIIGKEALRVWSPGYEKPSSETIAKMETIYKLYFNELDEWTRERLEYLFKDIYKYYVK